MIMSSAMDHRLDSLALCRESHGLSKQRPIGFQRICPSYLLVLMVFLAACGRAPSPTVGLYEALECPLDANVEQRVQCALFNVPERHDRREGKIIQVAVAQFMSANPNAASDPLVLLSGGPGDSNFENFFPVLSSPLGQILLSQRDVVIIESRGLFHSRPNLVANEVFSAQLEMVESNVTFEQFFAEATLNPNAGLITGVICGYRVEEIETPLTQQVRYLDKLVDELAKGRKMEKILRAS